MKKLLLLFILLLFSLTGCSETKSQEVTINAPYEILIDNTTFTYYDTKDNVPTEFNVLDNSLSNSQSIDNNVLIDTNGIIRFISITDKNVTTYNQIKVGDDINKVINAFNYEYQPKDTIYSVIFNNNVEENPTNQNKEDSWIWINYITDGSQITQIQIYDVKYGREMR